MGDDNVNNDDNESLEIRTNSRYLKVITIFIMAIASLLALKIILSTPNELAEAVGKIVTKTEDAYTKHIETKEKFFATFGPIIKQQRLSRLEFFRRNQVGLFRIIRYRGKDYKNHNYTQTYSTENDKKSVKELGVIAEQYCVIDAKGTFEFTYVVDMNFDKWDMSWNKEKLVLTLYPPEIIANTPAELEPIVYTTMADSFTIDEDYTKKVLAEEITSNLKQQLANEQKRFVYEEARYAIIKHYKGFFKLIPDFNNVVLPEIKVVFPHEKNSINYKVPMLIK